MGGELRLALGTSLGQLGVWNLTSGLPEHVLGAGRGQLRSLEFTPDGSQIVSSSSEGTAALWDVATGKALRRFVLSSPLSDAVLDPARSRVLLAVNGHARLRSRELPEQRVLAPDRMGLMRPYDRLAKDALRLSLGAASREFIPERELAADALRLDLWVAPDPERLSTLQPFGLLRRIAEEGPCAFEFFHQAPSLDEVLGSLQKALFLRRPARRDEPWLWIIAGGRPSHVITAFESRPERTARARRR